MAQFKKPSKKATIITAAIIIVLLIIAATGTVMFLRDRGQTEASEIGLESREQNSDSQTQTGEQATDEQTAPEEQTTTEEVATQGEEGTVANEWYERIKAEYDLYNNKNYKIAYEYGDGFGVNPDKFEIIDCDFRGFKTFNTYMIDFAFEDKFLTKFDEKTFFDKISLKKKDKEEYEGMYTVYENIANKYKDNNLNSNFGEYYYLCKCIERKSLKLLPKLGSYLYWIICGYGERPFFCVFSALAIIIIFSFLYLITGIDINGSVISYNFSNIHTWNIAKFIKDFNEALNLSVGMFAGVGIDNGKPTEIGYMVTNLEMLIGVVLIGVGVGTIARKVIR